MGSESIVCGEWRIVSVAEDDYNQRGIAELGLVH